MTTHEVSKDEMERLLAITFHRVEPGSDIDVQAAIWWFASDYHHGQGSTLYSVLSTSQFRPGVLHYNVLDESEDASAMYDTLVAAYAL